MTSNPNSPDFNYKDYSLEKLQEWVHDAMNGDASPNEIYSAIREAVREDYYYYKDRLSFAGELLSLLNGNGEGHLSCDKDDESPECKNAWSDFWEENYYPEEIKDDGMRPWGHSDLEYKGSTVSSVRKDEVKKWVLPVNVDGLTGDCFVNFPDDLLEATNLKEGDEIEWVEKGDGSYLLRKVIRPLGMDEC